MTDSASKVSSGFRTQLQEARDLITKLLPHALPNASPELTRASSYFDQILRHLLSIKSPAEQLPYIDTVTDSVLGDLSHLVDLISPPSPPQALLSTIVTSLGLQPLTDADLSLPLQSTWSSIASSHRDALDNTPDLKILADQLEFAFLSDSFTTLTRQLHETLGRPPGSVIPHPGPRPAATGPARPAHHGSHPLRFDRSAKQPPGARLNLHLNLNLNPTQPQFTIDQLRPEFSVRRAGLRLDDLIAKTDTFCAKVARDRAVQAVEYRRMSEALDEAVCRMLQELVTVPGKVQEWQGLNATFSGRLLSADSKLAGLAKIGFVRDLISDIGNAKTMEEMVSKQAAMDARLESLWRCRERLGSLEGRALLKMDTEIVDKMSRGFAGDLRQIRKELEGRVPSRPALDAAGRHIAELKRVVEVGRRVEPLVEAAEIAGRIAALDSNIDAMIRSEIRLASWDADPAREQRLRDEVETLRGEIRELEEQRAKKLAVLAKFEAFFGGFGRVCEGPAS
jgi:hypothetical protein